MKAEAAAESKQALERAAEAMERAAEALQKPAGSTEAAEAQREAVDALEDAARSAAEGAQPQTQEQKDKAEELAKRQEEIRQKLLDLAERNQEREGLANQSQKLDEAAESAGEAAESLQQEQLDEAAEKEEETQKKIEEALEDLEEEEEQYESLRQEELLFRIAEEVSEIRALHATASLETREVHESRGESTRVSRSMRIRLRNIAREEEALASRIDSIVEAITAEGTLVFAEVLDRASRDLSRIAKDLGDSGNYDAGPRTQALQSDVENGLGWLEEALRDELDRRSEEQQQQEQEQEQQQGEEKQQLVPDVAELKLLQKLETEVLDRIDQVRQLYPQIDEGGELDPLVRRDLLRLATRSERIHQLFRGMRQRLGIEMDGPDGQELEIEQPDSDDGEGDNK